MNTTLLSVEEDFDEDLLQLILDGESVEEKGPPLATTESRTGEPDTYISYIYLPQHSPFFFRCRRRFRRGSTPADPRYIYLSISIYLSVCISIYRVNPNLDNRSWLQDTLKRKLVDFAWIRRFFYLPGACSFFFRVNPAKSFNQPDFFYPERLL